MEPHPILDYNRVQCKPQIWPLGFESYQLFVMDLQNLCFGSDIMYILKHFGKTKECREEDKNENASNKIPSSFSYLCD